MGQVIKHLQDYEKMDWDNISGYSMEVARDEKSSEKKVFDWRLAIDDIPQDGDLTIYNGYSRFFSVLEGPAVKLLVENQFENTVQTFQQVHVDGSTAMTASLLAGPIKDLYLLFNNETYTGYLQWCNCGETQVFNTDAETLLIFSAAPKVTVLVDGRPQQLGHYDTLILTENTNEQQISIVESSYADHACVIQLAKHPQTES